MLTSIYTCKLTLLFNHKKKLKMNKKIVIAIVAIGLLIAGIYVFKTATKTIEPLVGKEKTSLIGKWIVDTSQKQYSYWIDSNHFIPILHVENDSIATVNVKVDSMLNYTYTKVGDTILLKESTGNEAKFTYVLQDSLLQLKGLSDSSFINFKQLKTSK